MSLAAAGFFAWVQSGAAYRDAHRQAVEAVPAGGRDWLDVGCGPGLVARLAAPERRVTAVDRDPAMIWVARRLGGRPPIDFRVGEVAALPEAAADVVSAASLLVVLSDPRAGLLQLWRAVRPGGHLLVVEATARMTAVRADAWAASWTGGGRSAVQLWARARQRRTLDPSLFEEIDPAQSLVVPLLDGMVEARVLQRRGG